MRNRVRIENKQHRKHVLIACVVAAVFGLLAIRANALDNGLGHKPPMGFNTWNAFGVNIDEEAVMSNIELMVSLGLRDVGYNYFNLDDAWMEMQRGDDGRMRAASDRFPRGMKALADFVHSKGMKFGLYSDAGPLTCAGRPGSLGYEEVDAQTFAEWGVDYLKYDNCYASSSSVIERYVRMRDALNATGRPVFYSMCDWGMASPHLWAPEVGNSWRTTGDIIATPQSIGDNLALSVGLSMYARSGAWNDADMLEVGNGDLQASVERTHFALWCLYKFPLLIGADLRNIKPPSLDILKAAEVIAINQDNLSVAGDLIWTQGHYQMYAAPLAGGARAVVMVNRNYWPPDYNMTVTWRQLGYRSRTKVAVRELFGGEDLGSAVGKYTFAVPPFDCHVIKLTPVDISHSHAIKLDEWRPWHHGFFGDRIEGPPVPPIPDKPPQPGSNTVSYRQPVRDDMYDDSFTTGVASTVASEAEIVVEVRDGTADDGTLELSADVERDVVDMLDTAADSTEKESAESDAVSDVAAEQYVRQLPRHVVVASDTTDRQN